MIAGLNVCCNVGPVEVVRTPYLELVLRRRAVCSRAVMEIPDPFGKVRAALTVGQAATLRFGYRRGTLWQEWQGTVEGIDQPRPGNAGEDAVSVQLVGREKLLTTTTICESFYNEPAATVAKRLLAATGLPVARVDIPDALLPHQIFSGVSVARAIKQVEQTLIHSFGFNMSRHALWLGQQGLVWSAGDEPGDIYTIATAKNLLAHTPPVAMGGMGVINSILLPGLWHSRQVRIQDARRNINQTVRALEVVHVLEAKGNTTSIRYGKEQGWG